MSKKLVDVVGTVLKVNNGDLPDATTYYFSWKMISKQWAYFSMNHIGIQNTTITYEGSDTHPDVSDDDADWRDVTQMLAGTGVTNFTSSGMLTVSKVVPVGRLRAKLVTTNATNAAQLDFTRIKHYA